MKYPAKSTLDEMAARMGANFNYDDDPFEIEIEPPAQADASSIPVWTTEVGGMIFTVILVDVRGRQQYQLYAVDRKWLLVGLFFLYVDALSEIQTWRVFLAKGGTLAGWKKAHPEGVQPQSVARLTFSGSKGQR